MTLDETIDSLQSIKDEFGEELTADHLTSIDIAIELAQQASAWRAIDNHPCNIKVPGETSG